MHHKQIELWGIASTSDHIKSKQHQFPLKSLLVQIQLFFTIEVENVTIKPQTHQSITKSIFAVHFTDCLEINEKGLCEEKKDGFMPYFSKSIYD